MADCCEDKSCEIEALRANHARVLWIVLVINAVMFFVEGGAGLLAHSTSLLADALDMLGDARQSLRRVRQRQTERRRRAAATAGKADGARRCR